MEEILLAISLFTTILVAMVAGIVWVRAKLVPGGDLTITVNGEKTFTTQAGGKLLNCLSDQGIFIASACGGGGTCALCTVKVHEGGGSILPVERGYITRKEALEGNRLSCQVPVKQSMQVEVPPEVFDTKRWTCTVRSNHSVALYIKELVLELPEGEEVNYKAGGYIQVETPPHKLDYAEFIIEDRFKEEWDRADIWRYKSDVKEEVIRAYSMASYPGEKGILSFNIRVAFPPADAPTDAPPGKVSSWLFDLKPGDPVTLSGPYGDFFIKDTDAEMIYIGRGAGMAPLRSHLYEVLLGQKTKRKVSYWYNARNGLESFYQKEFEELAKEFPNFSFHLALSRPRPEDNWEGPVGYIANVLHDQYLVDHPAPEDVEYYVCGPPVMMDSVFRMLEELGVESENIAYDDFGE
jgi:Na+-transporting NADH:ubiquinone oxidoreductase subunit F